MIISFIFILAGIGFLIFSLIYTKNRNGLQANNKREYLNIKKNKKKLNNLWVIDCIDNQMITVNKNQHSIVVELDSIEYSLLHKEEKLIVDRELVSISQMLKFPIQFLEIKRNIDIGEIIDKILVGTINTNEKMQEYASNIISHLENLQEDQNLFERKNYMIISSFNNKRTAEIELKEFYQLLKYHLMNIKVNVRLLSNEEIIELIYEQLHKGSSNKAMDIIEKGGLELYVT